MQLLQGTVYAFSTKGCGHPEDAEDMLQEVLMRSLRVWPKSAIPGRKMAAADLEAARDGSRLRQQQFQQCNFTLNSLNRLTPLGDFTTRFCGNWKSSISCARSLRFGVPTCC